MVALPIRDASDVAGARRAAVGFAKKIGFGEEAAGRVAIVATELATNIVKHGLGGEFLVDTYEDRTGCGVECLALDKGPGMENVDNALRDGYSTAGSAGTGLGAITRGSQFVDIYSRPGGGTGVLARMLQSRPANAAPSLLPFFGAVNVAKSGEEISGDAWAVESDERGFKLMVADGLGHGPIAAEASLAAARVFRENCALSPQEMIERMHKALQPTRGASVAVAEVDLTCKSVFFAGIGNITGSLITSAETRQMVSHHGTVGLVAKRVQRFAYPFDGPPTIVLCSDGLGTGWNLAAYPGVLGRHPTLIAGLLYRDFNRGRDDVTVVVARDPCR